MTQKGFACVKFSLFASCLLALACCGKKVYKTNNFLIKKPSWVEVNDGKYKFVGIGITDNVGNIGEILQKAQKDAVNGIYYSIFKTTFDIVDECLIDKNDDEVRRYKQQFIAMMNAFDTGFTLEKNIFTINNWLNPDDGKMYVKVIADEKKVLDRITLLIDGEIKVSQENNNLGYMAFLQDVRKKIGVLHSNR